jgi:general secretion pathway protein E
MNETIHQLVMKRATSTEIQQAAVEQGMRTMHLHGIKKALAGITTVEEVLRVTRAV